MQQCNVLCSLKSTSCGTMSKCLNRLEWCLSRGGRGQFILSKLPTIQWTIDTCSLKTAQHKYSSPLMMILSPPVRSWSKAFNSGRVRLSEIWGLFSATEPEGSLSTPRKKCLSMKTLKQPATTPLLWLESVGYLDSTSNSTILISSGK